MTSRRDMLQQSALGFGSLALTSLLRAENPLASVRISGHGPSASFLFMKGGPAHMDTFEDEPLLQRDHGKPLPFDKPKVTFAKTGNLLASPWRASRTVSAVTWSVVCSRTWQGMWMTLCLSTAHTAQTPPWRRVAEAAYRCG